ncbi:MAG: hypothetical protein AAGA03_07010, partial [Planctomycetota bacterium]
RTGALFPFSGKRYAWGTHFLTDPVIGFLCALSLIPSWNRWMIGLLAIYLAVAVVLKSLARRVAEKQRSLLGLAGERIHLRPRVFAPWRWLAIIDSEPQYLFFYLTPWKADSPQSTSRGIETRAAKLAEEDDLMRIFASLADFPRYEDTDRDGQSAIVVEDIQWWWKLPYRPMAISALVDAEGKPRDARESNKFSTHPAG